MKHRNSAVFVAVLFVILVIFVCYFLNNSMKTQYSQMFNNSGDPLITLNGKLNIKLFPGPPEYSSIQDGDRADYCWVLELTDASFSLALRAPVNKELALDIDDIIKKPNAREVLLVFDEEMNQLYQKYLEEPVSVEGFLFHAHTAHHYAPMLLEVKHIRQTGI